jgi:hypothetical protein
VGEITARNKTASGVIEGLPEGARLLERVARPLTGIEVREALKRHLLELARRLPTEEKVQQEFEQATIRRLGSDSRLGKMNLVYPGVGWKISVVKEIKGDGELENLWAQIELDLEVGKRNNWLIGDVGLGEEVERLEEEQIQTKIPDQTREMRGLPVEVDWVKPGTGERGKARFARQVEVGRGALEPVVVDRDEVGLTTAEAQREATLEQVQQETFATGDKVKLIGKEGEEAGILEAKAIKPEDMVPEMPVPKEALEQMVFQVNPVERPLEDLIGDLPKEAGKVERKVTVLPKPRKGRSYTNAGAETGLPIGQKKGGE